jgi:hypothetical protein
MTSRKRKRANPSVPAKWAIPKRISDNDFEELVAPVGSKSMEWEVPRDHAASAKVRLNNIVDYIAANMRHPAPKRKAVRSAVQAAVKALGKARERLGEIPTGDHALASLDTLTIATIVNDQWLREFSGGEFQPRRGRRHDPGPELGWRETYIEQEQWGLEIATALVGQIEAALMPSLEWTTKKNKRGGREAFPYREFLVSNLVSMWEDWGRSPTTGPRSDFVAFCGHVFDDVGWDSKGVQTSVSRVLSKRKAKRVKGEGRFQNQAF